MKAAPIWEQIGNTPCPTVQTEAGATG